eukprot:gene18611-biopygen5437
MLDNILHVGGASTALRAPPSPSGMRKSRIAEDDCRRVFGVQIRPRPCIFNRNPVSPHFLLTKTAESGVNLCKLRVTRCYTTTPPTPDNSNDAFNSPQLPAGIAKLEMRWGT